MSELDSIFNEDWGEDHRSGVVAVVGRPNVGKSTLINRVLGQKIAIVTPTPQTTRRQQLGIYTRDEVQILFIDTPGIHEPYHKLGEYMVRVAQRTFHDADVVLWVVDMGSAPTDEDKAIAALLAKTQTPILLAMNKVDLVKTDAGREVQEKLYVELVAAAAVHMVSAQDGTGVGALLDALVPYLPHGPRYYPKEQVSEVNLRFLAAEVVREQVLLNTQEEVPHAVAVDVESFEERHDEYIIHAVIYVEKPSQKGIIIGKRGTMIKQLGTDARHEMQRVFGHKVQLFLHVKVEKNWRSDVRAMRRFGYDVPKEDD